jgi:dCMP deaminase
MVISLTEKRPTWDEYFIEIAKVVGTRGTCNRGRNGAVLVKNKRILTTGYAGAPTSLPHCDVVGHMMVETTDSNGNRSRHCIRTTHAEQNAITQVALHGVSTDGATMYTKFVPCFACAKMIINAGIERVIAEKDYHDSNLTKEFLKQAGVKLVILTNEVEKYPDQK